MLITISWKCENCSEYVAMNIDKVAALQFRDDFGVVLRLVCEKCNYVQPCPLVKGE